MVKNKKRDGEEVYFISIGNMEIVLPKVDNYFRSFSNYIPMALTY